MTLFELLQATENMLYRFSHVKSQPKKVFEYRLKKLDAIQVKSQAYIDVVWSESISNKNKRFDLNVPVVSKGYWVCELKGLGYTLINHLTLHQAQRATKGKNAFVVVFVWPKKKMTKYDYQRELYVQSNIIRERIKESNDFPIRIKHLVIILNKVLRGRPYTDNEVEKLSAAQGFLEEVELLIEQLREQGQFKVLDKFLKE